MSHVLLLTLAPIFFVLILGFAAGRMRRLDSHHVAALNSLVMEFSLPAVLFVACASTPRSEMMQEGSVFAILCVAMLIPCLFWYYFRTKVSKFCLESPTMWRSQKQAPWLSRARFSALARWPPRLLCRIHIKKVR
jgi:predicted permease